ncbi:MAG: Glycosyl transferase family 2 [Candidatus Levybacteria bacterium GW2011_GWC2_40_7]|nr:MAG: Glycosyl transferase family 2 [Candidatus Levybacteria bacterium GW2011_GWC2_40_7]
MKLSIIIPNFNGEGILKKNLPHVLKSIEEYEGNAELIIVDDSSVDSSVGFIGEFISKNKDFEIKLFQNETNLGFSSTVNKGARNASGDIIILLNSDVEPRPDFLKYLVKNFENDNVFATGFLDESEENGKIVREDFSYTGGERLEREILFGRQEEAVLSESLYGRSLEAWMKSITLSTGTI